MTDDEGRAIAWVGKMQQRAMTWFGLPFVVGGVVGLAPSFWGFRELSLWLFGGWSVKLTALLACGPPLGLVAVGMRASRAFARWKLASHIERSARIHAVDEVALRQVLM